MPRLIPAVSLMTPKQPSSFGFAIEAPMVVALSGLAGVFIFLILAKHAYFCYLDGYSGFLQIPAHPNDKEKTTYTCLYGTFAYRLMPFGLCNAPTTFRRCMMAIFFSFIGKSLEVFMDEFSVHGPNLTDAFQTFLRYFTEVHLVLNWKKCHFVVTEGVVLVHVVSNRGIEVDRAKIERLPPLTNVKGVCSFLGHADFPKVVYPLTELLAKDTMFVFTSSCLDAFDKLKKALSSGPHYPTARLVTSF
ncbi:LOW QUALITY PROTEIN: hypothetical protein OSB04_011068 [Centaurea solstitialis]|uniref:Reverse transcriptase domain-containing protein n=1 Tax=Centaurea solstitialis TaxID=347529 RepID=A0AA38T8R5_9ASTR|nr:LOW QUALITY PROTEIN: hypothetical protein OSB04_011068 [Centaurea solstitialis]